MDPELVRAIGEAVEKIVLAVLAFFTWRASRNTARVEQKIDLHEEVQAARQEAVLSAVASSTRGGNPNP